MNQEKINCYNCSHFYVTWDRKFPKGCRALGFKTSQLPAIVVQKSSGNQCLYFKRKKE